MIEGLLVLEVRLVLKGLQVQRALLGQQVLQEKLVQLVQQVRQVLPDPLVQLEILGQPDQQV